jgi:hypothetical protein
MPALVAALLVLTLGGYVCAAAYVYRLGAVRISVVERMPGGHRIHLFVPAAAITPTLNFIPEDMWREKSGDLQPWLPVARTVAQKLERAPDTVLVEVMSPRERVSVVKRGSALVIDVDSPEESVRVSVPLPLVVAVAEKLQAKVPAV